MSDSPWTEAALADLEAHEFVPDRRENTYGEDESCMSCTCGDWAWDGNDEGCLREWWRHILAAPLAPRVAELQRAAKVEALAPVLALHAPIRRHPESRFQAHCGACSTGWTVHSDDGPFTHSVTWPCPTVLAVAPRTTQEDMAAVLDAAEIERGEL